MSFSHLKLFAAVAVAGSIVALPGCDLSPETPVLNGKRSDVVSIGPSPSTEDASGVDASDGTNTANRADHPLKPNIVFVLVDDLGWGDVGFNGSEIRTPTLDALASTGARLDRYYTYSVCSPTRAALMTGRTAFETGVDGPIGLDQGLPLNLTLLPEHLRDQGYQTAMVGKWHLGTRSLDYLPNQRGFESFYGFLHGFIDHYTHITPFGALDWQRDGETLRENGYSTDLLTAEAVRVISERDRERPLFLYLAYDAPHSPIQAPKEIVASYADIEDEVRREYAAMVEAMDTGLAEVVAKIEAEGIAGETLIVWASDNGGNLRAGASNGDLRDGKGSAFEGGVRVPALVNWPGVIPAGTVIESPVSVHDWAPTFVRLAGTDTGQIDPGYVGQDLMPLLGGDPSAGASFIVGGGRPLRLTNKAVVSWPWKLVAEMPRPPYESDDNLPLEESPVPISKPLLFNIEVDPFETNNIASDNPSISADLLKILNASPTARSRGEKDDIGMPGGPSEDPKAFLYGYAEETMEPAMETVLAHEQD
jgi:arylsulfatase A-like enzyme